MKLDHSPRPFLLGAAIFLGSAMVIAGCNKTHPDEKSAVTNSLSGNNLGSVDVSQDRDKGVVTLTGTVTNDSDKSRAESIAKAIAGSEWKNHAQLKGKCLVTILKATREHTR